MSWRAHILLMVMVSLWATRSAAQSAYSTAALDAAAALNLNRQLLDVSAPSELGEGRLKAIRPVDLLQIKAPVPRFTQRPVIGGEWGENNPNPQFKPGAWQDKCDRAARDFLQVRYKYDKNENYASAFNADQNYRKAAMEFDKNCFISLSAAPSLPAPLSSAIGYLTLDGNPFCMAFRIGPAQLATARHCFFNKLKSKEQLSTATRVTQVKFQSIGNAATSVGVSGFQAVRPIDDTSDNQISHADDLIRLTLVSDLPGITTAIAFRTPRVHEQFAVFGVNGYIVSNPPATLLRESMADSCYVGPIVDRCIFHGCGTAPGFSGSPLISLDAGLQPTIIGMHIASAVDPGACTASKRIGNVGALLDNLKISPGGSGK